jgi:hypothetical protein
VLLTEARAWQEERQAKHRLTLAYSIAALASQAFSGKLQSLESILNTKPPTSVIRDEDHQRLMKWKDRIQQLRNKQRGG